ncbi:hypothetical protein KP509_32G020900 [Ceratopteris richardii]|uniref:cAMP-dependent protein kinase regulatory subunit n=1 Tax=Ceratopteris richardii TaxID=49495 RepID=A0A8T2QTE2_CERRI|nr:hypothetical protein KP509_32G020900 [Ceratopteris richardii]KAH7286741.1 hypothetical protein KP509_32G020900 [Ceratopteris richardii]KAH7286745.1 hypothetical protein KP509_32G020900 [Ceratopteris richardii]
MSSSKTSSGPNLASKVSKLFKSFKKDLKDEEKPALQRQPTANRRSAVCAEVSVPEETYEAKVFPKSEAARNRLQYCLRNNYLFTKLDPEQTRTVIDAVEEVKYKAGDIIIKQGAPGDCFYFLEDGKCEVWVLKPGKTTEALMKTYSPGESFGELALLYNAPRAATVKAITDCTLWAVDRVTFRSILLHSTSSKRKMYEKFLQDVPLLKGDAEAKKGGNVLMRYKRGDYFGELALLNKKPRAATVCAVTKCKCATIDRKSFKRLFGKLEDILERNKQEYSGTEQKPAKKLSWFGKNTERKNT